MYVHMCITKFEFFTISFTSFHFHLYARTDIEMDKKKYKNQESKNQKSKKIMNQFLYKLYYYKYKL